MTEQQFYPEDWKRLRLDHEDRQFCDDGPFHRLYNYDAFPYLKANGGWTWGERSTYLGRDGKEYEAVEVGCDYAHLWDHDGGYWQGKDDIERDAKRSIDLLIEMFPKRRRRCAYSGTWDDPENFYEARNGNLVHVTYRDKFNRDDNGWTGWKPAA